MERFFYELPSLERKEDILDYINEFDKYESNLNGFGPLYKICEGYTFEDALEMCLKSKDSEYAKSINRLPSETLLLIRESDNKLVGAINIRINISEEVSYSRGHIGYSIRPTERQKGYNKINLYMGLKEALKLGYKEIKILCEETNIASDKTLLALGGKLVKREIDNDGDMIHVYSFDIDECLDKYKDIYSEYIKE